MDATKRTKSRKNSTSSYASKCRHGAYARKRLRENLYSLCATSLRTIYILSRCYAFFGTARLRFRNFGLPVFQEKFQILKSNSYRHSSFYKMFELKLVLVRQTIYVLRRIRVFQDQSVQF